MPTLIIKTNPLAALTTIDDLGIVVTAAGGSITLTDREDIRGVAVSLDLVALATNNAHGPDSSTLILNDGTFDIAQSVIEPFMASLLMAKTGPFSIPVRDAIGKDTNLIFYDPANYTETDDTVDGHLEGLDNALIATGISDEEHKTLRQLIHLADGVGGPFESFASNAFRELLPSADPFPTSVIWWESNSKLKKIVEKTITRNANQTPATIAWKAYASDGSTVLATVTDTISYSGVFETTRTRAIV